MERGLGNGGEHYLAAHFGFTEYKKKKATEPHDRRALMLTRGKARRREKSVLD